MINKINLYFSYLKSDIATRIKILNRSAVTISISYTRAKLIYSPIKVFEINNNKYFNIFVGKHLKNLSYNGK